MMGIVAPRPISMPLPLVLHGDILDPWCWIAEKRVSIAVEELHGRFLPLEHAPLPRRWEPRAPTASERQNRIRELKRAAREADAPPFSTELWSDSGAGPQSSGPPLLAIAAARLQGLAAANRLRAALREAALVAGLDISRRDIITEVATRCGLDLADFVPAFDAPGTERALLDDIEESYVLGVDAGPALVINDDWLVSGARSLRHYRRLLKRYLAMRAGTPVAHTVH
jgi:predicted DsbA family dithiol-disulfide isomerase